MSKETNRLLGHAEEADGIDEYDNPLPDWWVGLFWLTIIWGVGYGIHYHFIAHRSAEKALAAEIAMAEERYPQQAMVAADFEVTPEAIAAGEAVYQANCVACHGAALEGGIGPNLVDSEWVHGGDRETVVRIISEGVTEKGMLAWGPIIGPEKVNQVAAYVLSRNDGANGQ